MCRDVEHGGRRCPNDGATARRNRRRNAKLVKEHEDNTIGGVTPDVTEINGASSAENIVERARVVIGEYNDIQKRIGSEPKIPHWHSNKLTDDEILAEQKLIELGDVVEELATKYGYPSDEEIVSESMWIEDNQSRIRKMGYNLASEFHSKTGIGVNYDNDEYVFSFYNKYNNLEEAIKEHNSNRREDSNLDNAYASFEEYKSKREELYSYWDTRVDSLSKMINSRSDAYRKALEDIGVEFAGTDDLEVVATSPLELSVRKQATLYPKSWVENSNKMKKKLEAKYEKGEGANYHYGQGVITADPDVDDDSIMTHELGHRMEHANRDIGEAERRFLNRRAGFVDYYSGKRDKKPQEASINGYKEDIGYPEAGFAINYSSRVYDFNKTNNTPEKRKEYIDKQGSLKGKGFYEVLTTGMESTFFGRHGGGVGMNHMKKDAEHTRFILGLLASTAK